MLTDDPRAALILVVEDDDSHAELIRRSFQASPEVYRLAFAASLMEARQIIAQHPPTLVFSDFRLPDGDGSMLIASAHNAYPVVILTSQGSEEHAVEFIKTGALDYVVKSIESFTAMPRIAQRSIRDWTLIQERVRADEATLCAKREWEQTFNAVPDLIALIDTRNVITRVNRAMAERCGLGPDELVGRRCYELIHGLNGPPPGCPHAGMLRDGREHCKEVHEEHLNGIFDVTVSPLYDADGCITACVHVMRDITGRKNAEKAQQDLENQLHQVRKLESLGALAGGIAHDFNNILTIIQGHSYMASKELVAAGLNPDNILQIEDAVHRAAALCRQMLTYAGKRPLVRTGVDLGRLVDEVVQMLRSSLKKNVVINLSAPGKIPAILAYSSQMHQIVMNLLINAAEAIGEKYGVIHVALARVSIQVDAAETDFMGNPMPAGEYVRLEVADDGCGMDENAQRRIFEPFFSTKDTGRGLGMSVILGIVKSHAGFLKFTSQAGIGASFVIFLPLPVESGAIGEASPAEVRPEAYCKGTLLLVDDEEALRMVGTALLSALGFSVITAGNGREALEIYREQGSGIDLILMDLTMPEMGGLEAYHKVRTLDSVVPVVLCSGYSDEEIEKEISNDSRAGFLEKPYRPQQLVDLLLNILG